MVLIDCVIHFSQCEVDLRILTGCGRSGSMAPYTIPRCALHICKMSGCAFSFMEHVKPPLWPFTWPVQNVPDVQLADGKNWYFLGCSPYSKHPSTLFCQVPNQAQSEIPVQLFCTTRGEDNVTWVASSPLGERTVFCPLPCLSAAGIRVHCAVTLVHIPHVSVVVLYCGRFQSVSVLITEITFCWRMMHVC
jgi:hypothetical protein